MPETPLSTACRVIADRLFSLRVLHGNVQVLRELTYQDGATVEEFGDELQLAGAPQAIVDGITFSEWACANALEVYGNMNNVNRAIEIAAPNIVAGCDWMAANAPANTAPINNLPAPPTGPADTPLMITGMSITDPDSPAVNVRIEAGAGIAGINVLPGGVIIGNDTNDVRISGSVGQVNQSLGLVTATPTPAFAGVTGIQITTDDSSNPYVVDVLQITFT